MSSASSLFDQLAERYDAWYEGPVGQVVFPLEVAVLRPLLEPAPKPWLEVGVGSGRFAHALGVEVGIDPAHRPLLLARQRNIAVLQARGEQLPFRTGVFGGVLLVVTLCFVDEPIALLREVQRVLHPDGVLVLGMVFADSPWGDFYRRKGEAGHPFYRAARFLSRAEVRAMLAAAGFQVVAARCTLRQPPADEGLQPEPVWEGDFPDAGFVSWQAVPQGAVRCAKIAGR